MADDPRSVAADPRAPADERFDAQAEMQRVFRPLASELMPAADVMRAIDYIEEQHAQGDAMMKARSGAGNLLRFPGRFSPPPARGMQSVQVDDLTVQVTGNWFEKPSPIDFIGLRSMVDQTPILSSVVLTRIRHVQRFCSISEDGGPGFEIRHRDREHKATKSDKDAMALLARFMGNCGWESKPRQRKRLKRDNLATFMAKSVRDSLTMDACPIETEWKRDKSLGLDGFYAVDGATVRLCTERGYEGDDEIFALQVVDGRVVTAYDYDKLIYEVRNPRTDVHLSGYGLGETELLIRVVTGFLNAMNLNISGFTDNSIPKGLLHLVGDYDTEDLNAFKRYWNGMVKGTNKAWALPVMVSKDKDGSASFEKFGVEFNEMYFSKWMTFLTSIVCAVYGMAPDEINFESFSAQKSSLSGDDTGEKLADAKDKGLRPLLAFYEQTFSDFIISEFDENLCFRWAGLDQKDANREWEGKKLVLTVDELRAEMGYKAHPDETLGTAPLNPSLIGPWQQAQQPPQQGQDFGPGGGDQQDFGQVGPDDGGDGGEGQGDDPSAPPEPGQPQQPGQPGGAGGGDFGQGGGGGQDFGKALPLIYAISEGDQ